MNSLSWLIYLADIIGNFRVILFVSGLFGVSVLLVWMAGVAIEDATPPKIKYFSWVLPCFIIASLIPSESTMKLIAASEFGERIVNSERVQGIVDPGLKYVEQWLKDQLKKEK